jgi:hypothetical protein
MSTTNPSIVVIDDNGTLLAQLTEGLKSRLADEGVEIRSWMPTKGDDPVKAFEEVVDDGTVLVVTDYDLTRNGLMGLFGVSIVSWCQGRLIPVGDFSRGNSTALPSVPNLFELRVPTVADEATKYTVAMFRGFKRLREMLAGDPELLSLRSPAEILSAVLGRSSLEDSFTLYMSRVAASNSSLLERIRRVSTEDSTTSDDEKARLLAYVLGHVLVNAVLRYPGPILSEEALAAYCATTSEESETLQTLFTSSRYRGPFGEDQVFFWRAAVDEMIITEAADVADRDYETSGAFNRAVVETRLDRQLLRHDCDRCDGENGGYLCPFTDRPVCERSDCSVAANSWIPAGADLCRVEREFYDEWAPLLGL